MFFFLTLPSHFAKLFFVIMKIYYFYLLHPYPKTSLTVADFTRQRLPERKLLSHICTLLYGVYTLLIRLRVISLVFQPIVAKDKIFYQGFLYIICRYNDKMKFEIVFMKVFFFNYIIILYWVGNRYFNF